MCPQRRGTLRLNPMRHRTEYQIVNSRDEVLHTLPSREQADEVLAQMTYTGYYDCRIKEHRVDCIKPGFGRDPDIED